MNISDFKGLVFTSVVGLEQQSEEVIFTSSCCRKFKMYHEQNCCESVYVSDVYVSNVCGDTSELVGAEVVSAEERTIESETDWGTMTATFYDIQTTAGSVTIRWNSESNGYYSESVYIEEI